MYIFYEKFDLPEMNSAKEVLDFWEQIDGELECYDKKFWSKAIELARCDSFDLLKEHFIDMLCYNGIFKYKKK